MLAVHHYRAAIHACREVAETQQTPSWSDVSPPSARLSAASAPQVAGSSGGPDLSPLTRFWGTLNLRVCCWEQSRPLSIPLIPDRATPASHSFYQCDDAQALTSRLSARLMMHRWIPRSNSSWSRATTPRPHRPRRNRSVTSRR